MFSAEVHRGGRASGKREGNRVARIDRATRRQVICSFIGLSSADLTPGLYNQQFSAHFLSMLLPMDIAPENIITGFRSAKLVLLCNGDVKLKGDGLAWIDTKSGGSCGLNHGGIARNMERDIAEECGHKLMRHEISITKLNDCRRPCHESKPTRGPPFCDVKGFLADLNGHVNVS